MRSVEPAPAGLLERALAVRAARARRRRDAAWVSVGVAVGLLLGLGVSPALRAEVPPSVVVQAPSSDVPVRFVLHAPGAARVALVGSFTDWDPERIELTPGPDGLFHVVVPLPRGRHEYQFLVDGERWVVDPAAPLSLDDGFGHRNAVIEV